MQELLFSIDYPAYLNYSGLGATAGHEPVFDNFTLTGLDNEQLPLDGTNVLGENVDDSGGLSIAFHVYRKHILENDGVKEKRLPGFEHLSPEQSFFLSHDVFTCEIVPKSRAQRLIDTDERAVLYYRNIGVFQNSQEFAEAYNCPAGSPMNPPKKYSI
ncbi:hypothetical protein HPULCUR_007695 [Helicostylum pulchrum]|uniref:Peptidase M13 C-terminal domain-containing protein n=1 Tax=Helicostylum pulchrum TaxID=562976 RepID=A0ABP9Y5I3_9FUNG